MRLYFLVTVVCIYTFGINFIAANEDYIPISEILTFALVTNNTQCVTISILNDFVIEDDEVFFLQSIDITNLTETTPQTVMITIVDDDGKIVTVASMC